MKTTIKPFSSLDKSLRDTIIHKSVIKINLGLFIQSVETVLNTESDVLTLEEVHKLIESVIVDLNDIIITKSIEDECKD